MVPLLTTLVGVLGKGLNAFFGFKQEQGNVINTAIDTMGRVSESDSSYASASSGAIQALYQNGPLIERLWRPLLMWVCMGLILSRWFGYEIAPDLPAAEVSRIYDWLEIGLIGYVPLRSFEKIMRGFQIGSILKTFVSKKIV